MITLYGLACIAIAEYIRLHYKPSLDNTDADSQWDFEQGLCPSHRLPNFEHINNQLKERLNYRL